MFGKIPRGRSERELERAPKAVHRAPGNVAIMSDIGFRRLGNSGLVVSDVGLGCNNLGFKLDADESREVVHAALDAGITLFDTADSYGLSEQRLGELLGKDRDSIVLATKFGSDLNGANGEDWGARGSRRYIQRAVERSLRLLQTDWIDLYQLHRPDPLTPIEETLAALTDLVRSGKVRYLGHSNFSGWQVADAEWIARTRGYEHFISAQNEYSLLERGVETDVVPALQKYGLGLLPYFPLASGILTGKYRRGQAAPAGSRLQAWGREAQLTDRVFDVVDKLEYFANARSISLLEVAIGGLAAQPTVSSVIAGATSAAQVQANVDAGRWRPTASEREELSAITAVG
ncbi:aryl-alcohol dehydrogenase-like predicted oxidoreductase [Jatrophihabitans sp. GAS493]|nr:aryl-alcohol dehydrogenase-like predicted oxidoreductase [Jatrophihabitans sp. GAS493]